MDKAKIAFLAVAAIAVLAAAGLGFAAKTKFDAAAEARSKRDAASSELDRIYRSEVFPNAENVKAMEEVLEEYGACLFSFTNELLKCNVAKIAEGEMSPSAFQSKLSEVVRFLQSKAPLVEGRKAVGDGFAFGFEAYFGKETMPSAEEVPELVRQLTTTTLLALEAYGAQISQLTKVERDARDKATLELKQGGDRRREAEPEPEPEPKKRGRRRQQQEEKKAPLFTSQPMVLEFTARQNALLDLLNRLNGIRKPFVVVKSISAKKTGDDLRKAPAQEAVAQAEASPSRRERETRAPRREREGREGRESRRTRRGGQDGEAPAAEAKAAPAAPQPSEMPPELRVVSGPDIDPPLNVRLELEIFNFGVEAE